MADLIDQLREAVKADPDRPAHIAARVGMSKSQLSRLLSGERGLSLAGAEQLADALGLQLVLVRKGRKPARRNAR